MTVGRMTIVAFAVIVGVFTSGLAICAAGAMQPESEQMACCEGGHHDCGPSGTAAECCTMTQPQPQQSSLTKVDPFNKPVRAILQSLTAVQPVHFEPPDILVVARSSPVQQVKPAGPPSCIAFSTLLI